MVLLALALAAANPAGGPHPPNPSRAVRQATASVRIVSGERVSADRLPVTAIITDTVVRGADGSTTHARLVEFP